MSNVRFDPSLPFDLSLPFSARKIIIPKQLLSRGRDRSGANQIAGPFAALIALRPIIRVDPNSKYGFPDFAQVLWC